jgi:hypothetical protein
MKYVLVSGGKFVDKGVQKLLLIVNQVLSAALGRVLLVRHVTKAQSVHC